MTLLKLTLTFIFESELRIPEVEKRGEVVQDQEVV